MIRFYSHSGVHTLQSVQFIPASLEEVWSYFSKPSNLKQITPPEMGFDITSPVPLEAMHPGQIITYRVKAGGVSWNWVTEITHVQELNRFVDEQRFGPYAFWHHLHQFRSVKGGTEMTDRVTYRLPFRLLGGALINRLYVQPQLAHVFGFRRSRVDELFPSV